ncbi:hypothetical protein H4S14_001115 [Agrobacterium vitis]|nr:hypothetical protein [Agrobacterium vitis]MBE1437384.1 hypothetical protein [Agrobacterium vitis]
MKRLDVGAKRKPAIVPVIVPDLLVSVRFSTGHPGKEGEPGLRFIQSDVTDFR